MQLFELTIRMLLATIALRYISKRSQDFPGRDFLLVAAFAVIIGTVLIQGATLGVVIRWAGLKETDADRARLTMSQAEASMAQAQATLVERRAYDAKGELIHPRLLERHK